MKCTVGQLKRFLVQFDDELVVMGGGCCDLNASDFDLDEDLKVINIKNRDTKEDIIVLRIGKENVCYSEVYRESF